MKKILAINLSPRKNGTSSGLLTKCSEYLEGRECTVQRIDLYSHVDKLDKIHPLVNESDTLVLSGPCYVNTYPADTIRLLEEFKEHPEILHGQNLYGIIQGGMPYAHTHASGLNMLKVFAGKVNVLYKGGFIMGLGALLDGQPLEKLPNGRIVTRHFAVFCGHIQKGEESPDSVYEAALLKVPGFVTWFLAKTMNHRIDKTYASRGMDAHTPNPYLNDDLTEIAEVPRLFQRGRS